MTNDFNEVMHGVRQYLASRDVKREGMRLEFTFPTMGAAYEMQYHLKKEMDRINGDWFDYNTNVFRIQGVQIKVDAYPRSKWPEAI